MDTPKIKAILIAAVKHTQHLTIVSETMRSLARALVDAGLLEHRPSDENHSEYYRASDDLDVRITALCAPPAPDAALVAELARITAERDAAQTEIAGVKFALPSLFSQRQKTVIDRVTDLVGNRDGWERSAHAARADFSTMTGEVAKLRSELACVTAERDVLKAQLAAIGRKCQIYGGDGVLDQFNRMVEYFDAMERDFDVLKEERDSIAGLFEAEPGTLLEIVKRIARSRTYSMAQAAKYKDDVDDLKAQLAAKPEPVASTKFESDTCTPNVKVDMISTDTPPVTIAKPETGEISPLPPWAEWVEAGNNRMILADRRYDGVGEAWTIADIDHVPGHLEWRVWSPSPYRRVAGWSSDSLLSAQMDAQNAVDWEAWAKANAPETSEPKPVPVPDAEIAAVVAEMSSAIEYSGGDIRCPISVATVRRWHTTLQSLGLETAALRTENARLKATISDEIDKCVSWQKRAYKSECERDAIKTTLAPVPDAEISRVLEDMMPGHGKPPLTKERIANWHDALQSLGLEVGVLRDSIAQCRMALPEELRGGSVPQGIAGLRHALEQQEKSEALTELREFQATKERDDLTLRVCQAAASCDQEDMPVTFQALALEMHERGLLRWEHGGPFTHKGRYTLVEGIEQRIAEPAPAPAEVVPMDVRITDTLRAAVGCATASAYLGYACGRLGQLLAQLGLVVPYTAGYLVPDDLEARLEALQQPPRMVWVKTADLDFQMPKPAGATRTEAPTHCPVCGHRTERPWAACGKCPPMAPVTSIGPAPGAADAPVDQLMRGLRSMAKIQRFNETATERVTLTAIENPDGSLRVANTTANHAKLKAIRAQQASVNRAKLVRAGAAIPAAPGAAGALAELLGETPLPPVERNAAELGDLDGYPSPAPVIGDLCPSMAQLAARLYLVMHADGDTTLQEHAQMWRDAQDRDARMALGFGTIDRLVEAAERGEIAWSSERGWYRPACLACKDTGQVLEFDGPYNCGECKVR